MITAEDFFEAYTWQDFVKGLKDFVNFRRGIPSDADLRNPGVGFVFREVLKWTYLEETEDLKQYVKYCHKRGWLQSDQADTETRYTLSSPLHIFYISWRLTPSVINCPFSTIKDLAFEVIKKFKPSQLSSPKSIGKTITDRPLEARYQCEFYSALHDLLGGVLICPELLSAPGAKSGRINFFIPEKKWGIELTREGSKLLEDSSRFGPKGAYGAWLGSNDMLNHIFLDCRTGMPQEPHPGRDHPLKHLVIVTGLSFTGIPNFFHVVFIDGFTRVNIFDNNLKLVDDFLLLEA